MNSMKKNNDGALPRKAPCAGLEVLWQGILDVIPAAAYTCDAKGLITYFNPFAETLWGRAPKLRHASERYCGSHRLYLSDGTPIRHEECWMALALLRDEAHIGRKIVVERRDGSRILGEAYAYPLRNDRSQLVGAVNLVADLTAPDERAGASKPDHAPIAKDAALAMIEVAASVLTGMTWETSAFS
jgi:two-component system, LuxR family, sensor kinase FixL